MICLSWHPSSTSSCYFGLFVVVVFLHIHVFSAFSKQRVPKTTVSPRKNWCSAWVLKMPNSAQNSAGTIGTASHSDISVHGFVTAQKEHVGPTLLSISSYYLMDISCNTFGVATSPIVADLSTSFNGMSLNMWSCTLRVIIINFGTVFVGFPRSTKRALLKFWALSRAINVKKTRDAQTTESKFYEH